MTDLGKLDCMNELKNIPEEQKRFLRKAVLFSSGALLLASCALWFFKDSAMELFGFDEFTLNILAIGCCAMAVIDLVMVKLFFEEDTK